MTPNFEVFSKRSAPQTSEPLVTIQKQGTISINPAAHSAIGSPTHVELLFDVGARVVGVRAASADSTDAYPLRPQGKSASGPMLISGRAFTRFYEIPTDIARRWVAEVVEGVLCVRLETAHTEIPSARAPSVVID